MLYATYMNDPLAYYQQFREAYEAALAFDDDQKGQRDSYAQNIKDLAEDSSMRRQLGDRRELARIFDKLDTSSLTGSTPSTYLNEIQTVICTLDAQEPSCSISFSVIAIHPGHKSSLNSETIHVFFNSRITNPIKVMELTTRHPLSSMQSQDLKMNFITGFKPSNFFAIVPAMIKDLPTSSANYRKESHFLDIPCIETTHRKDFFENREVPLLL